MISFGGSGNRDGVCSRGCKRSSRSREEGDQEIARVHHKQVCAMG